LKQQSYRRLVSGQTGSFGASILRFILAVAAVFYSLVVRLRNFLYSNGLLKVRHVDAATFCVGNITVGGTGKTPLVVWLYKLITQRYKCAILTRGYKAGAQEHRDLKDEIAVLADSCPDAEVIVNPDRVAGAREAINKYAAKVLIMDDGFQHRRLARDLDIVTIDATCPFGYGKLLPAGLLREPVSSLRRAGAVVITRCNQVSEAELDGLEEKLRRRIPDTIIARSIHTPVYAKSEDNNEIGIEQLTGKKVFAFCGIGNPDAFFETVKDIGAHQVGSKAYNDHYHYTDACLTEISEQARQSGADLILTTRKDWTKVFSTSKFPVSESKSHLPFAYLAIEIKFLSGEDKLRALINDTLAGRIHRE
jgi:tetraacyldisaccharide 4'-kinase